MANINEIAKAAQDKVKAEQAKHTTTIGSDVYKIKPMKWEDALDLAEHISKKILPSVGVSVDDMMKDEYEDRSVFTEALLHLSERLDGETLKNWSYCVFEGMTKNGAEFDLSEQDSSFLGAWRKLFVFALLENLSPLFAEGWGEELGKLMNLLNPAQNQE